MTFFSANGPLYDSVWTSWDDPVRSTGRYNPITHSQTTDRIRHSRKNEPDSGSGSLVDVRGKALITTKRHQINVCEVDEAPSIVWAVKSGQGCLMYSPPPTTTTRHILTPPIPLSGIIWLSVFCSYPESYCSFCHVLFSANNPIFWLFSRKFFSTFSVRNRLFFLWLSFSR